DKASKYIRRRGTTRFTEGGLAQDMLYAVENYGAMPQAVYPGIGRDTIMGRNYQMADKLKAYLDSVLAKNPDTVPANWKEGFIFILESYIGKPPVQFEYNGKQYTPQTFAAENITVKAADFTGLTSFTHHPFYSSFVMEVPDNYNSNIYNNLPLDELIQTVKACIKKGYTLTWDADVSNSGFQSKKGIAMWTNNSTDAKALPDFTEQPFNQQIRQDLFDSQVTQDDHLMQITGLAKDAAGNDWFIVKNSYGNRGPYNGYVYVSMPYFAINTISVLVNKKALPKEVLKKLKARE
ncbi:MAG TPA: C1 family peptidase, partial [Panacibacter sp.]|nr:C1 family peptidase [Panacibacter sp.]